MLVLKTIIGGDWNLVLDHTLDYYNYKHHNKIKAQEQVDNLMINLEYLEGTFSRNEKIYMASKYTASGK